MIRHLEVLMHLMRKRRKINSKSSLSRDLKQLKYAYASLCIHHINVNLSRCYSGGTVPNIGIGIDLVFKKD